jgi:hypothetical protein
MATKAAVEDKGKEKAPETQPVAAKVHWNTQSLPFAAKRLLGILTKLVGEYESRYGQLK